MGMVGNQEWICFMKSFEGLGECFPIPGRIANPPSSSGFSLGSNQIINGINILLPDAGFVEITIGKAISSC
jgi:hypothetical protein